MGTEDLASPKIAAAQRRVGQLNSQRVITPSDLRHMPGRFLVRWIQREINTYCERTNR